jgi:hypothetical protein
VAHAVVARGATTVHDPGGGKPAHLWSNLYARDVHDAPLGYEGRQSMNVHEKWAELEACRREIATMRHELELVVVPEHAAARRQRLETALTREQELLRQLSEG